MAYKVTWYVDQQIILGRFWGEQTEEDVIASMNEMAILFQESAYNMVHLIADVSGVEKPLSFLKTVKLTNEQKTQPNQGWVISVGEQNPIVRLITGGVTSIIGQRMRSVKTIEDALEFLKQADASIQWDKVKDE